MLPGSEKPSNLPVTVRRNYVGLFFLGCLATLLLLGFLLGVSYKESERQAELAARNTVEILEAHLNATLRRLQSDLEQVAATVPREGMEQKGASRFREQINGDLILHARQFPEVVGYRVMDREGALLYTSQPDLPRATAQGRSYFDELRIEPQKGLVFSEVSVGRMTPRPLIFAAVPVRGGDGRFLGIVMAPIDLEYFQRLFDAVDLGANAVITFRRSDDGRLVLRRPARPGAVNKSLQNNPMHERIEAGEREGSIRFVAHLDGVERIYAYRRVGDYPFYVAAGIATYDYLASWRSTAAVALLACTGILLALGIVMWRLRRLEAKEHQLARDLQKSEATYRSLLEAAPFPILIAGLDDARVRYLNQRAAQWLQAEPREVLGRSARALYPEPATRDRIVALLKERGEVRDFEVELCQRDGELRWAIVSMELIDFNGEPCTFAAFNDISERKAAELATADANHRLQVQLDEIQRLQAALKEQAIRDGLTGLYNRRYLDETLEREVSRAKREGNSLSLILLDIDHFKKVNDTYGHLAGDLVLKALAGRLAADVRAEDVPCRYGGEEFLILLPGMSLENAVERAEEWRRMISEIEVPFAGTTLRITVSLGVAAYPDHARIPDELAQCADRALYQAKHWGRNRVAVHQPQVLA